MDKIYTISGFAQHGKDTFAMLLSEKLSEYGKKSLIIHNADYLKYIARNYMGWDGRKDDKGRHILQFLGTEAVREGLNRPLFWIEKTCDAIEIVQDSYDYVMIPDTRFINEIYYPKARFPGKVASVHVYRDNYQSTLTEEQKNHRSERELLGFDFDFYVRSDNGMANLSRATEEFIFKAGLYI